VAAVHEFSESNGVGEDVTDSITNLNMGDDDSVNIVVATHPVLASENAYEKYIRAKFSDTFTEISNMLFWKSSGAYLTGELIKAAANVAYVQPVKTTSSVATVDIPIIEGSALSIQSAAGTATIVAAGYTKYICLQLQTTVSTPSGDLNQKVFTFQYDEV